MDAVLLPSAPELDEVATALDAPVERYGSVQDALTRLRGGGVACAVVDAVATDHDAGGVVRRLRRESDAAIALAAPPDGAGAALASDADAVVDRTAPAATARRLASLLTDHALDRDERRAAGARGLVRDTSAVVRDADGEAELATVADTVVERLGGSAPYPVAWVGEYDPDREVVGPVAAAGVPLSHLRSLSVRRNGEGGGTGATRRAVAAEGGAAAFVGDGDDGSATGGTGTLLAVRIPTEPVAVLTLIADRPGGLATEERSALIDLAGAIAVTVEGDGTTARRGEDRVRLLADALAHELSNQLGAASLQLDLAEEHGDAEHFEHVSRALDRLEGMVTETRALAREEPEPEWTDLEEVTEAAWKAIPADGATLEVEAGTLEVDPALLRLALVNLLRNAVEHGSTSPRPGDQDAVEHGSTSSQPGADDAAEHGSTDEAEADLRVEVGLHGESGLYVADDGVGVPPEERDAVLEWGHSTNDGSGIGLALVELVAERHGWTVQVTESDGGGAKFVMAPSD